MADRPPRALVTGGTGFLGQHLLRALVDRGAERIVVLCRTPPRSIVFPFEQHPEVEVVTGVDVGDAATLPSFEGIDAVFHLAVQPDWSDASRAESERVNVGGTRNVLGRCEEAGVATMVFVSSVCALGYRPDGGALTEDYAFDWGLRHSVYMRSKVLAERACIEAPRGRTRVVIGEPAVIIGPGDVHNLNHLLDYVRTGRLLVSPPGVFNFVDVRDVASALLVLAERGDDRERYAIANENLTYPAFLDAVRTALGRRVPLVTLPRWSRDLFYWPLQALEMLGVDFERRRFGSKRFEVMFRDRPVSAAKLRALGWAPAYTMAKSVADCAAFGTRRPAS